MAAISIIASAGSSPTKFLIAPLDMFVYFAQYIIAYNRHTYKIQIATIYEIYKIKIGNIVLYICMC